MNADKPADKAELSSIAAQERQKELRRNMLRSTVTEPLLSRINANPDGVFDVIIALNELYQGGLDGALAEAERRAKAWNVKYSSVSNYLFARLTAEQIRILAVETQDLNSANRRNEAVVYRIWEDSDIGVTLTRSLTTVKADAAQRSFHALGEGIVWAVLDSGIDGQHVHFAEKQTLHGRIDTLGIRAPIEHRDYTPDGEAQQAGSPVQRERSTGEASRVRFLTAWGTVRMSRGSSPATGPPR